MTVADLAIIAGLVFAWGTVSARLERFDMAQRYFFHALRMAKASGDRGFGGYVVALLANQALYLGLYRQVIQYAETALRGARQLSKRAGDVLGVPTAPPGGERPRTTSNPATSTGSPWIPSPA